MPQRAGVNGARHEILAGAALAGDQDGQVVALQALDLVGHPLHRRAGADEARQQRLELPLHDRRRDLDRPLPGLAEVEPLPEHGAQHPEPLRSRPR